MKMASLYSLVEYARMHLSLVFTFASGVGLHLFYFGRSEHHMYGVRYLQASILFFAACVLCLTTRYGVQLDVAFKQVFIHTAVLLIGLYSSLLWYRLLWHPLRRFPGPFGARITSLWLSTQIERGNAHHKMVALHKEYGPFIRIGSSDLSIAHPLGVAAVYGHGSGCRKATWYDEDWPRSSLHTTRNHSWHGQRRRVWSTGFSDKALRSYEQRIRQYNDSLENQMLKNARQPVNVAKWFNYYSFDVMGDLAFNKNFGMLEKGESHWAISLLNDAMGLQGLKLPTWIFRILLAIPGLAHKYWKFIKYCDQQLEDRMREKQVGKTSDVMAALLPSQDSKHSQRPSEEELLTLRSDSRTIIVAGSDTTASALTHVFFYLARDPSLMQRIREELRTSGWEIGGDNSHQSIQKAELINAVINETLRLHPAVSTAMTRKTPPEGITVGETSVPGNMTVWCPQYVLSRDENNYERAEEFVPERWYSKPEMIKQKEAYAPFSAGKCPSCCSIDVQHLPHAYFSVSIQGAWGINNGIFALTTQSITGPYGCIGKPLALMELRMVVASLVTRFNIVLAPGEDGHDLLERSRDQFTLNLGDLFLVFSEIGESSR